MADLSAAWHCAAMARPDPRPAGAAPTQSRLHEQALAHLARFATTQVGLVRVLDRKIDRWARAAAGEGQDPDAIAAASQAARAAARAVAARLVASGVVDDAAFAASRVRSLTRAGRSRRGTAAHLAARGVAGETLRDALPEDPEAELSAAIAFARRRRIGPFATAEPDTDTRRRALGMMARAGFAQSVANQALAMLPEEAEAMLLRLKQS